MGISFTFVSVFCYLGPTYGYNAIVGAVLVGGPIEGTLGLFAKYWKQLSVLFGLVVGYIVAMHGYGGFLRTQRNISHSAPSHHAI